MTTTITHTGSKIRRNKHSIIHRSFADAKRLLMSTPPYEISELLRSKQSCKSDVKSWATANMPTLNDNKTELKLVTSKRTNHLHNLPASITIGNAKVPFKQFVKNFGFILDCHLTMNPHVSNNALTCYFDLRRLASIRRFLRSTMLFTMYIKPLSAIIDSHSIIHDSFADDLQLQMSAPPDRISELLHTLQSCMSGVKAWATANMLKLNDNKTKLMLVVSKRTKHLHSLPTSITMGNSQISFKQSAKNLGFTLDCHLTMNAHVFNIARTCYFELRRLASIRRFLTSTATATHVSAFALSLIDFCNSLLFGSTHHVTSHLQRMQKYTARVIFRLPKSSNMTTHLKSLHWLPVKVRSTYKIACLCYHCHSSTAPSYVSSCLSPLIDLSISITYLLLSL